MKKTYFVVLMVVVLVALMSGTAFATRYDSGYQAFTTSPHGQYDLNSTKCAACHAVHNPGAVLSASSATTKSTEASRNAAIAAPGGSTEALLRGDIANACSYCHVSSNFPDIKAVYSRVPANYTNPDGRAHSNVTGSFGDTSVRCGDCHQVHGASTVMAATGDLYMYGKILRNITAGYDPDTGGSFAVNGNANAPVQANITRWCTGCHVYYEAGFNDNSHVMTDTIAAYGNSQAAPSVRVLPVAWYASTDCRSCHQDGVTDQASVGNTGVNNYPHFTAGYRFLREATSSVAASAPAQVPAAGNAAKDGACLICHSNGTFGAGLTF